MTVHVPVPPLIVNVAPLFEHAPALLYVTALPEAPPVAATVKFEPKGALDGACVVTLMTCVALEAVTDSVIWGAAL